MQQTVMQNTCISSKSTHKLNKKYNNRDEYLARINGMLRSDQDSM